MLQIKKFYFNPLRECTCVLSDATSQAVIIDPGCSSERERQRLAEYVSDNGLKPVMVLLTHGHFDHVLGLDFTVKTWNIDVYMNITDKAQFGFVSEYCRMMGMEAPEVPDNIVNIEDGQKVRFGESELEVIYTPGHTAGGVCYYCRDSKVLISGDTLFQGSIGRTDHPTGDYDALMKSIMTRIIPLGDDIEVIPGHGYPTTIGDERLKNPFLQPF